MSLTNEEIARKLRDAATELARTHSNLYRVRAFRSAALAVLGLKGQVSELVANGRTHELERVPGIGKSLADAITRYIRLAPPRDGITT